MCLGLWVGDFGVMGVMGYECGAMGYGLGVPGYGSGVMAYGMSA